MQRHHRRIGCCGADSAGLNILACAGPPRRPQASHGHRLARAKRDVIRLLFCRRNFLPFVEAARDDKAPSRFESVAKHRLAMNFVSWRNRRRFSVGNLHSELTLPVHIGTSGWSYDHWVGVPYSGAASSLDGLKSMPKSSRPSRGQHILPVAE